MKDAGFRHFGAEHEVLATESQALLKIRIVPAWAPGVPGPPPDTGNGNATTGGAYAPGALRHDLSDPSGCARTTRRDHDGSGRQPLVHRERGRRDRANDGCGSAHPVHAAGY